MDGWKDVTSIILAFPIRKYKNNYSISEKEALTYVAALRKLKEYLLGRKFTLKTDHRAFETLLSQQKTSRSNSRVEIWREKVSIYD